MAQRKKHFIPLCSQFQIYGLNKNFSIIKLLTKKVFNEK